MIPLLQDLWGNPKNISCILKLIKCYKTHTVTVTDSDCNVGEERNM